MWFWTKRILLTIVGVMFGVRNDIIKDAWVADYGHRHLKELEDAQKKQAAALERIAQASNQQLSESQIQQIVGILRQGSSSQSSEVASHEQGPERRLKRGPWG